MRFHSGVDEVHVSPLFWWTDDPEQTCITALFAVLIEKNDLPKVVFRRNEDLFRNLRILKHHKRSQL